jgi:hypothetical protein
MISSTCLPRTAAIVDVAQFPQPVDGGGHDVAGCWALDLVLMSGCPQPRRTARTGRGDDAVPCGAGDSTRGANFRSLWEWWLPRRKLEQFLLASSIPLGGRRELADLHKPKRRCGPVATTTSAPDLKIRPPLTVLDTRLSRRPAP